MKDSMTITFREGLPGFEERHQFMLEFLEEGSPLCRLQSVEDEDLAFILADPFVFYPSYEFQLPERAITELQIQSPADIMVLVVVNVRDDLATAMVNLVAPVVIHMGSGQGKQVILTNTEYLTRHPLLADTDGQEEES
ncbi:flagellar assembly protein FliW [Paenibacillus mesotrionivorans]|uniref:Flagellar assembly protein FliW n=1 Tax=Paenibacillus mesotrionivorans TaxID=3160968 RepID=A0ACC7P2Y2_9BACL